MIIVLYQLLCACIALLIIWNMLRSEKTQEKLVYSFLIIPLLLRAFLVK
jgi:hypothetical protein